MAAPSRWRRSRHRERLSELQRHQTVRRQDGDRGRDEATSSNDIVFMERASSGLIAYIIATGDFPSAVSMVPRQGLAQRLRQRAGHRRHSLSVKHHSQRHHPAGWCGGLRSRPACQRQRLHPPIRRRRAVADPRPVKPDHRRADADAERLAGTAVRSDQTDLDRRACRRLRCVEAAATYWPLYLQGGCFRLNVDRQNNPVRLSSAEFPGG